MIAAGLNCLKNAVQGDNGFVPGETNRTFTIAAADSQQICDIPRIAERFQV